MKNDKVNQTIIRSSKSLAADMTDIIYGKLPPQAVDLEEAVLGAFMIDRDVLRFLEELKPEYFYDDRHRLICQAIKRLHEKRSVVDILTVTEECRKMGKLEDAGGPFYITSLTSRVASAAHTEHHIRIIQQKYVGRTLILVGTGMVHDAYSDETDIFELLDRSKEMIKEVETGMGLDAGVQTLEDAVVELRRPDKASAPLITGVTGYDRYMDAEPGTLTVVSGRTGMGKTVYIQEEAEACAEAGYPTAIFTMEVSSRVLTARMAADSGVPFERILYNQVKAGEENQLNRRLSHMQSLPLNLIDDPKQLQDLLRLIRRQVFEGIKRIYIDQLRFVKFSEEGFDGVTARSSEVVRQIKMAAKELNIPITLVAQVNREAQKKGGDFRPDLIDLKDTGSLEEDADNVVLLWRPEYYYQKGYDRFERVFCKARGIQREVCSKGLLEVNHAKVRNGEPGIDAWTFDGPRFAIKEYNEQFYKQSHDDDEDDDLPW